MAKKEILTDYWVRDLLTEAEIKLEPQGSSILEINEALKTASKKGTGNVGFPEFVGVVKDFLIVIENKAELSKHVKLDEKGIISNDVKNIKEYAVNGALFYGKHLAKNTSYKKIIAFGISGNEKKHKISPIYIDETEYYRELTEVESFISFNSDNIEEYYIREILKEETNSEKETVEILKEASVLHEDLRNYGNVTEGDKPLIVSGILLALRETEHKNFSIESLSGDEIKTDGQKIYAAIIDSLGRVNVSPGVKKDKILSQFSLIRDTEKLNKINSKLGKTPLKHYVEFLDKKIYKSIKYTKSSEDYLGRFYGEFMSYSGGDGFISYEKSYMNENLPVITIGNETATPFVQATCNFFTGTKVNIMKSKKIVSENILFFVAQSMKQQKSKYSYSITINSTRLKKQKILLPINDNLEPDYDYMEQYTKNLIYKKTNQYLNYLKYKEKGGENLNESGSNDKVC